MANYRSLEDSKLTFQNTARAQFVVGITNCVLQCPQLEL